MSIILPSTPAPRKITPVPISARSELNAAFGGNTQRQNRLGSRNSLIVEMPPMTYDRSLEWTGLLSETDTCVLSLNEPGVDMGGCGAPLVKGAGQSGSTLVTDGWTPSAYIPMGKWISFTVSGLIFAYRTTAAVAANSAGEADLPIRPMLRASPADNAAISFNPAQIEGFPSLPDDAFAVGVDRLVYLTFTITERR